MLSQFVACIALLMLLATPLFYILTKHFYAEDMMDIIEAVGQGHPMPALDLEEDIMLGVMIQFGVITLVLAVAIALTLRFISRRLWRPFDRTLRLAEDFRLEDGVVPSFPDSDVAEFARLDDTLRTLMRNNLDAFRTQKEFTENASHELQTPLAVIQGKLDLLMQDPDLTERQAGMVQSLYQVSARLARLNRNLLLLAKIDNLQYQMMEDIDLTAFIGERMDDFAALAGDIKLRQTFGTPPLVVRTNRPLLESLVNNLLANAVRHNCPDGEIDIAVAGKTLAVRNTSDEPPLDASHVFNRFYRPSENTPGNGLGLAIVESICHYHGWAVSYAYDTRSRRGWHVFTVTCA